MNAWQIVLLVVVILVVLALLAWAASRRRLGARREEQARAHLNEARERQARADSARAVAEENAARLRRERAELEQRTAQQQRESARLASDAERDQARAAELQERARKLAPHVADENAAGVAAGTAADRDGDGYVDTTARNGYAGTAARDGYADDTAGGGYADDAVRDGAVRDSHAGITTPGTADRYDDSTVRDADTGTDDRPPATAYRHTPPVTDPEGTADPAVDRGRTLDDDPALDRDGGSHRMEDRLSDRDARPDSDGDGRPDGSLRERLDGEDGTYVDRDTSYQDGTYVDRETVVDRDSGTAREETHVDRDADGVPDGRERGGGLRRLKDRLTGRVD